MNDLTERQKRFADYYIETLNAYESAVRAGYSERYAKGNSYKLVDNGGIKKYIDRKLKEIESEQIADATEVLKYLTRVIRCEESEKTIEGEIEPKISERTKAAELLGRRYALFIDSVEHSGEVNISSKAKEIEERLFGKDG